MDEAAFFETFVWAVSALTLARLTVAREEVTRAFLGVCVLGQMSAALGLRTGDAACIRVGHVAFTGLLWTGAIVLPRGLELMLVASLAAFTLASRRLLGHCMFSHARGSTSTNDDRYDLLYVGPMVLALARLATIREKNTAP